MARKILLADDSVTAQNMGRKILADAGYEVITVNNGSAALKKITEHKPDLIVLDVYMPGYSGLEVCQRLKEVAETARIPVLLTVGKLEPFKTDEAKRVRADGFIVKPFEASELLSALSKLEDKIVPRGESKPGRFARATAAIDEGRDRTVAADEDNGWKSRIAFPSKKKESGPEPDADDPAIYNPVNKDLRTVVQHQPSTPVQEVVREEKVDLGALAPEGLPKDVTPEEIAALAAAAAQMQGKILEIKAEEQQAPVEAKTETSQPAPEAIPESPSAAATFAEQAVQATADTPSSTGEPSAVASLSAAPQDIAIAHDVTEAPVTMAAAAGANSGGTTSRWTAVAVALAPEDSGISLEQEMQRAYAEFAASHADSNNLSSAPFIAEPVADIVAALSIEAPVAEPTPEIPAIAEPEAGSSVMSAASDVISPAVEEFEPVAGPDAIAATHVENVSAVESTVAAEQQTAPVAEVTQDQAPIAQEPSKSEEPVATEQPENSPAITADLHAEAESQRPPVVTPEVTEIEAAAEPTNQSQPSSEIKSEVSAEPASRVEGETKDPETTDTTAAAWATWRKIRESGDAHSPETSGNEKTEIEAVAAAMAAAAGAEKSPEDSMDPNSDPSIASIVDSVLADLRPKIVEEISRKLGKKK